MDNLTALAALNWWEIFLGIVLIIVCTVYLVDLGKKFLHIFGIKFQKDLDKEKEHELLITTSENLAKLQERHNKDEKEFRQCLYDFIDEQKKENQALRDEMRQYGQNRIHDREQSREIQKELTDSIKILADNQTDTADKIEALMCGSKELLGSTIDQLYSKYIGLNGIPENEVDELDDIFQAYKKLNGNHRRDLKYNYIKNHLEVIPVETKLVIKDE